MRFKEITYSPQWIRYTPESLQADFIEYKKKEDSKWRSRSNYIGSRFPIFDTIEDFKKALDDAVIVNIDQLSDDVNNLTKNDSIDGIKAMVSSYVKPRDVDRIITGIKEGAKIPLPIIIRGSSGTWIMAGNTRQAVARVMGVPPKALMVDVVDNPAMLTEAIKLSKYEPMVMKTIKDTLFRGLNNLKKDFEKNKNEWQALNDEITQTGSLKSADKKVNDFMHTYVHRQLRWVLNELLDTIYKENLLAKYKIRVEFQDIPTPGHADGVVIVINNDLIKEMVDGINRTLYNSIFDWFESGENKDMLSEYMRVLSDDRALARLFELYYDDNKKVIKEVASTFIHEAVHARQHQIQFDKGKYNTEYRSYLDKKKGEMVNRMLAWRASGGSFDDDPQIRKLHAASPQEIDAFAHEIALQILGEWSINDITDVQQYDAETLGDIMKSVPYYIRNHWKKPETPVEQKIFKRYVNRTVAQLRDYFEQAKQE